MPTTDAMALQKEALELVASFPGSRRIVGPAQAEALLRVDARLEPVLAQLAQQYATNYQKSTDVETRLWHAVFDLVKAFTAALRRRAARGLSARGAQALAAICCRGSSSVSSTIEGSTANSGCSATARGFPRNGANFTSSTNSRATRGWQRNELAYGAGMFSRPGVCVEQEYLKTLLLMRLDSGNFTPDQVEWVARQLEGWAGSLMLVPPPGSGASFFVDLTGSQGLRRQDKAPSGDRVLLLDAGPIYTQIVERMRWLPERDDEAPATGRAAAARAATAADAPRLALWPRCDRSIAARHALFDECRCPRRGRTRAAHARDRRNRTAARQRPDAGCRGELRRDHRHGHSGRRPGNRDAPGARRDLEDGRSQRHRLPAHRARQRKPRRSSGRSSR
mgnify:CR=1 FL=1